MAHPAVTTPETTPPPPLALGIPESQHALGVGRSTIYELLESGELESIKVGRRRLVLYRSIVAYVDRMTELSGAGGPDAA